MCIKYTYVQAVFKENRCFKNDENKAATIYSASI